MMIPCRCEEGDTCMICLANHMQAQVSSWRLRSVPVGSDLLLSATRFRFMGDCFVAEKRSSQWHL